MNRSCFGINKVLDLKPLISFLQELFLQFNQYSVNAVVNNSVIGCFEKHYIFVLFLQHQSMKLMHNCTSRIIALPHKQISPCEV